MKIRTRLSLYFTLISSCLLLTVLGCVYYLFERNNQEDFNRRIRERIGFAAGVYLEADETPDSTLETLKKKFIITLPQEEIHFYDSNNHSAFIKGGHYQWNNAFINRVRVAGYVESKFDESQVVGIWYNDNQGDYVIIASAVDVNGKTRRIMLIKIMGLLFVLQLFIQLLSGRWFAARILRPIQRVNSQVQAITATDLHKRLEEHREKDEFGLLAHNFNQLLERIERAFDTHKMFIANASHELKTPLTGIIGEIEVALSRERDPLDYLQTLRSILSQAERLHIIVDNLLLLTYEENNRSVRPLIAVRVDDLLWELQEQFEREGYDCVHIVMNDLPEDHDLLNIWGNKTLFALALTNIIRNGIKYSNGRKVIIQLNVEPGSIRIDITDQGIGISEDAIKNIFEPFYRAQTAERYDGSGIGLYVAKRIITLYHGSIEVSSSVHKGTTFTVSFNSLL